MTERMRSGGGEEERAEEMASSISLGSGVMEGRYLGLQCFSGPIMS